MQWSDEELTILDQNYGKIKLKDWSGLINRTHSAIRWKAQELGLKANRGVTNKRTQFNLSFFSDPNPINSYIAGLIAADGCICTEKNSVWFYQKERYLIDYMLKCMSANNNVYFRKREKTQEYSVLFTSSEFVSDLRRHFGITDNKSKNGLPAPKIDKIFAPFYTAGLIDGDGSISLIDGNLSFTLLCSKEVLRWINESLSFDMCINRRKDCNVELYRMTGSLDKGKTFLNKIYHSLTNNDILISNKWQKVSHAKSDHAVSDQ